MPICTVWNNSAIPYSRYCILGNLEITECSETLPVSECYSHNYTHNIHSNIHTQTGSTICQHRPIFKDSCYEETPEVGALSWIPPQSCSAPERYEVLYTQTGCNASNATMGRIESTNLTSIILKSADTLCIKVRAVIDVSQSCYSFYSMCAQVASLKHGM